MRYTLMTYKSLFKSFLLLSLLIICVLALLLPFIYVNPPQVVAPEIVEDKTTLVKVIRELPKHNVNLPSFAKIHDVKAKKRAFFDFIRPSIIRGNQKVLALREQLKALHHKFMAKQAWSESEFLLFEQLCKQYLIKPTYTRDEKLFALLHRVDIVPLDIVMVQAANESAWGTSRFAQIGLNFFGIWCFKPGCGMIPTGRIEGGDHEVMAFKSVDAAVDRYLFNINTNRAYYIFREIRYQFRQEKIPLASKILVTGLIHYSERKGDYVVDLLNMLKHNKRYFIQ